MRFYEFIKKIGYELWHDLIPKIALILFPLYIGIFVLWSEGKHDFSEVLDPRTILVYGSTFLLSSLYAWFKNINYKDGNYKKNFPELVIFFILVVPIFILYSYTFSEKINLYRWWAISFFGISLLVYGFYEMKSEFISEKSNFNRESENQLDEMKNNMDIG